MSQGSKLSGMIFALMLVGFFSPNVQAGDGLLARLRNKICKAKYSPAPTCCVQKVYETYVKQVRTAEQARCISEELYQFEMYLAKMAYCQGLEECRNPCNYQTMASAPGAATGVAGPVPSRACIIAYFACRDAGEEPETCRVNLEMCDAPPQNGFQQH